MVFDFPYFVAGNVGKKKGQISYILL